MLKQKVVDKTMARDSRPRKSYDQALMDGIKQALTLLS